MNRLYTFILLCLMSGFMSYAQTSGYRGSRAFVQLNSVSSIATFQQNMNKEVKAFRLNKSIALEGGYTIDNKNMLAISYGYFKANINHVAVSSPDGIIGWRFTEPGSGFTENVLVVPKNGYYLTAKTYSLDYLFHTKNFIAPIGPYILVGINQVVYDIHAPNNDNGAYFVTEDADLDNGFQYGIGGKFGEFDVNDRQTMTRVKLAIGAKWIFTEKLFYDIAIQSQLGGFDTDTYLSSADLDDFIYLRAKKRISQRDFIGLRMGIGYFL